MDNLSNDLEKGVLNSRRDRAMAAHNVGCGVYAATWGIPTVLALYAGGEISMGLIAWGIALAITICINGTNALNRKQSSDEFDSRVSAQNQFIADTLQNQDEFTVSREIRDAGGDFSIAIDDQHKKWSVVLPSQKAFYLYDFDNLIGYDICKDGKSVVSGNVSEAILGGILFGAVGAAAGASASKEVKETCSDFFMDITVNDPQTPLLRLNLLPGGEKSTETERKYAFAITREITAQFAYIKANSYAQTEEPPAASSTDRYAELEQLFSLKEKGIITEDEYSQKKKELLNLH